MIGKQETTHIRVFVSSHKLIDALGRKLAQRGRAWSQSDVVAEALEALEKKISKKSIQPTY